MNEKSLFCFKTIVPKQNVDISSLFCGDEWKILVRSNTVCKLFFKRSIEIPDLSLLTGDDHQKRMISTRQKRLLFISPISTIIPEKIWWGDFGTEVAKLIFSITTILNQKQESFSQNEKDREEIIKLEDQETELDVQCEIQLKGLAVYANVTIQIPKIMIQTDDKTYKEDQIKILLAEYEQRSQKRKRLFYEIA